MSDLCIQFEWEDPRSAKGWELRATWARLTITVGNVPVTRVLDRQSRGVRDCVYGPLYPLAEWLATHWWALRCEVEAPGTERQRTYPSRHVLACAGEGFALPNLMLSPCGQETLLCWDAIDLPDARVTFLESGSVTVRSSVVREECTRFADAVYARLDSEGVTGTLFQEEWEAIQNCDSAEVSFCEVAAALGLDPFALDDGERARLVQAHAAVPPELADEFVASVDFDRLGEAIPDLRRAIEQIRDSTVAVPALTELRQHHPRIDHSAPPWRQGYDFARALRSQLGLDGHPLRDAVGIARAIRADASALKQTILPPPRANWCFDALVGINQRDSPAFVIGKRREDSIRFAFSRSLYEYLVAPEAPISALISPAHSDRQRANRAFAAEFLAPVDMLRQRIQARTVDDETLDDLADEFGVSTFVIRHQIQNHQLARLQPAR